MSYSGRKLESNIEREIEREREGGGGKRTESLHYSDYAYFRARNFNASSPRLRCAYVMPCTTILAGLSLLSPHFLSASRPALSPELFCNLPR